MTAAVQTDPTDDAPRGRLTRWFGPLTAVRVVALVVAFALLGGAVGWAVGRSDADPLSATDVGFLQDMAFHHEQAVEMSVILIGKDDVSASLKAYAIEIVVGQQAERGIFNATLDRFGHPSAPGDTVMGWMGSGFEVPLYEMEGLATDEQMEELRAAEGEEAESLWIALMTEHHLGGLHMADWEARHGSDPTAVNQAKAMVKTQRSEVLDLERYREQHDLPYPEGFADPRQDQRLNPLSFDPAGE